METNKAATPLLLLGTFFWGMTFVFVKEATSLLNFYNFLSYRFFIAAIVLGLLFIKRFRAFNLGKVDNFKGKIEKGMRMKGVEPSRA